MPCRLFAFLLLAASARADSVVVFNEIHYHPADAGEALEYIELRNQMSIDIDLSGWTLDGVGDYVFPAGTKIKAGGYTVIARDPAALAAATGFNGALGPFTARLDNGGELLTLRNNSGRVMDEVNYSDNAPWPEGADGSGASLARIAPNTASGSAASWVASRTPNGTPGAANVTGPPVEFAGLEISELSGTAAPGFFVELRNSGVSPVTLDGLVISNGHLSHTLSPGSLPAGGYLVVDSAALGFTPAAGDPLFLTGPAGASLIDAARVGAIPAARANGVTRGVFYRPVSLTQGAANDIHLEDAVVINELLYHHAPDQPSRVMVFDAVSPWKYQQSGAEPAGNWRAPAYDDSAWPQGAGIQGFETDATLKALIGTTLQRFIGGVPPNQPMTYYFRKSFTWAGPPASLRLDLLLDDSAVIYLNGTEIHRQGLPAGTVSYSTAAIADIGDATWTTVSLPASRLVSGVNVLAVEVHQSAPGSSDLMFGMAAAADTAWVENGQQWLELYNRSGDRTIDLSGWTLNGPAEFTFPSGASLPPGGFAVLARKPSDFMAEYPGVPLMGGFAGKLGGASGHLVLRDAAGNPADEVRYSDGKPWPAAADGGGSSLELKDARADNSKAEAWAASDETARSQWAAYTIRGTATNRLPGAPANFQELQLGLLDSGGECLLDDFSVVEDPAGTALQRLANGDFSAGAAGWRFRGNHQRSTVEPEPGNSGNNVLHLRASGETEYMGNQIETTFASGSIVEGRTYEISFRAKWLTGSNQLNSRLYFDRLGGVTILKRPSAPGTPGAPNSTRVPNLGPTYSGLAHTPIVPAAGQPVTVSVAATDPDGVASLQLRYSVNGGAFASVPMTAGAGGRHTANIPGQAASAVVQFYIHGQDGAGAGSDYPAAGPASRALYKVNDGTASTARQNVRIVMTPGDVDQLYGATNVLSNERLPATVIANESEVYYDVDGVRLKGSYVGRNNNRTGYNVTMNADQPFRGVHPKFALDRATISNAPGGEVGDIGEAFLFLIYTQAGGNLPSRYDDIVQCLAPRAGFTNAALLRLAGFDNDYLDSVYPNGSDGEVFEYETPRWTATTSDGTATGLKLPGNGFLQMVIGSDFGDEKETFRAGYFLMNNNSRDDYSRMIAMNRTFGLSGAPFSNAIGDVIDMDQWARVLAVQALMGHLDIFNRGLTHNTRFYVRPSDKRVLLLPWDWDFIFQETGQSLMGDAPGVAKLFTIGSFRRAFYGHLRDIMARSFNRAWLDPWVDHYGTVSGRNYANVKTFVTSRIASVTGQLATAAPPVAFAITTSGGADFSVAAATATLEGSGGVDIRSILVNGRALTTPVRWTGFSTWQLDVPLAPGRNDLTLTAVNFDGSTLTDVIAVTNTLTVSPASAANLAVSEIMYHPATNDDAEFVELVNFSSAPLSLAGVAFTSGISFVFPPGATLEAGVRVILVRDPAAFAAEYGNALVPAGTYTGALSNSGERLLLVAADSSTIADFTWSDHFQWPAGSDGDGASMVLKIPGTDPANPSNWRESTLPGGNPGTSDSVPFTGQPNLDADGDGLPALLEYAFGTSDTIPNAAPLTIATDAAGILLSARLGLGADRVTVSPQRSADSTHWTSESPGFVLLSTINNGDGTVTLQWLAPSDGAARQYFRLKAELVP